ncbi:hypothetical protein [Streptomyces sp. NPDC052535]|uniref:hypothetical protein n=1 Tax=Streptomyces sp. NPDC052535 TaxID=3155531 RepID=UPI003426C1D8
MTASWPSEFVGRLHVDFGEQAPGSERWRRQPSASYACVCGFYRRATGAKHVATFTATIPAAHKAACRFHRTTASAR